MSKSLDIQTKWGVRLAKSKKFVKSTGDILSSPPKAGIINQIEQRPATFSDLQKKLGLSSGNLNYHLLKLDSAGLLTKDAEDKYAITPLGRDVAKTVKKVLEASKEIE